MQWLLERISTSSLPIHFGTRDRQAHPDDFAKLLKLKVLTRGGNLGEVDCELCDENHQCQVREENGKLFYICENGAGRKELTDADVALFEYNNSAFLKLLADELGITISHSGIFSDMSEHTTNSLYEVGTVRHRQATAEVLFLRDGAVQEVSLYMAQVRNRPQVFLSTLKKPNVRVQSEPVSFCALADILATDNVGAVFDKARFVEHLNIRRVHLNKETGQLYLDGKLIYIPEQHGPHHWFLLYLWDAWEIPRTHQEIHNYVRPKIGTDVADTPQKFCHKLKSEIKKKCKNIDKIITTPSTGSYMMADPTQ